MTLGGGKKDCSRIVTIGIGQSTNQQNRLRRRQRRMSDASVSVVGADHTNTNSVSELSSSDTSYGRATKNYALSGILPRG